MTIEFDEEIGCPEGEVGWSGERRLKCSELCNAKKKCKSCIFLQKVCIECGWKTRQLKGIEVCEKCGNELEQRYIKSNIIWV